MIDATAPKPAGRVVDRVMGQISRCAAVSARNASSLVQIAARIAKEQSTEAVLILYYQGV